MGYREIVSALTTAGIVFALVLGSALAVMFGRDLLPESHLSADSKDAVRVGIALIATMEALVLSLLIASAKNSYDTRRNLLVRLSADIVLLDHELAHYGPETKDARSLLQRSVAATLDRFWPGEGATPVAKLVIASSIDALYDAIETLSPRNDDQRALRGQALTLALEVARERTLLASNLGSSIPIPFLVVLVFWLCIIFASFGLFAPRNATVMIVYCACALSVSGAIFLILELDRSIGGLLQISGDPLRAALAELGR
jgi:hypothetical protein